MKDLFTMHTNPPIESHNPLISNYVIGKEGKLEYSVNKDKSNFVGDLINIAGESCFGNKDCIDRKNMEAEAKLLESKAILASQTKADAEDNTMKYAMIGMGSLVVLAIVGVILMKVIKKKK